MVTRRELLQAGCASTASAIASPFIIKGANAASADHVLTFGHTFGSATEDRMITGLGLFKRKAEEYSGGKLKIDIHEAGSLGGQTVLPQKVLTGSIQGCQVSTQNFTPFSDVYNLLDFPFLFPTNDAFENALSSREFLDSRFISQPRDKGFEVLPGMWANAGYRVLGISKKANRVVKTPEDLDDIKIRVTGSKIEQQVFDMFPANPVSIAWGETYQALQQGAADALNVGLGPLTATKIFETLGSATLTQINMNCHITVMNQKWFGGLPTNVQEAIMMAAADSFAFQRQEQARANTEMLDMWRANGIEIYVPSASERKAWQEQAGHTLPVWNEFKTKYGHNSYRLLDSLVS